ncbi:amidase [Nakamurella endophytica]|uniref:Amidase n=1 Tax=Nakamurella endophytica TaxID=1748367 RepID=A0A917WB56_9ACTN|nr:amidase [Nakamurella endophytica]GGL90440.1 amidase [Nakamurella endophytica]
MHAQHVTPTNTKVAGIDVDKTTIPQLQALMNRHRLSSRQLVAFYERRIALLNPKLHAVITVSKSAMAEAAAADAARKHGDRRPMLGIPVLVKDNIDTTGMPTTAGSLALAGSTPPDAFIVRRLKAQGAIVIGKTNLSEWANYRGDQSSSGWSGVGGQTNMPYVLDRNPCGSSSGSGVAAAADLATVAVGTETDGSVVCPSGQNGVVGIKPTLGLASRSGIIPISAQQDTAGPIARNVTDAAVLLGALTGVDAKDSWTRYQQGHVTTNYTRYLKAGSLKGARLGVWRAGNFGVSPETDAIMEQTIARLKALGATIVDPADVPIDAAYADENTALQYEFKHDIAAYLQTYTSAKYPKTLQDLIDFNNRHADAELKYFGQEIFLQAQARGPLTDPAYQAARRNARTVAQHAIDDTLARYKLDAIIAPTNSPAWPTDLINGDHFLLGSSSPAAISGYANITVPAGYSFGLPVGVSFMAGKWSEPKLLGLAYAWEQATKIRKAPQYLPTLRLN